MSIFLILGCLPKEAVQVRVSVECSVTRIFFYSERLQPQAQPPKLEDSPMSVLVSLFNVFTATLHSWMPSLYPQLEDAPSSADKRPTWHGEHWWKYDSPFDSGASRNLKCIRTCFLFIFYLFLSQNHTLWRGHARNLFPFIYTSFFITKNIFCPRNVFMCLVWFAYWTMIHPLRDINHLAFVTETIFATFWGRVLLLISDTFPSILPISISHDGTYFSVIYVSLVSI
jgi:hypothetical protein